MENIQTATLWKVDPTHSEVQFKVRHLVISTVTGSFKKFDGSVEKVKDNSFDQASVKFSVDVNSIDTNQSDRDTHLKSEDFFAAETYPQMTFDGKFHELSGNKFEVRGKLQIRDNVKEVAFKAELGGVMEDGYGNTKAGFEIEGKINRKEYGLSWNQLTEAGGVVVADEVKMLLNLQFVLQS